MGAVGRRGRLAGRPLLLLVLAVVAVFHAPGTTAIPHHPAPHATPATALQRLTRVQGGSSGAVGGGSSFFPVFPPASTVPVQPPKSGSSASRGSTEGSGLWGSQHFDERPLIIDPRATDSLKARDSRIGLIRRVFATLSCQLLLTALVTFGFFQNPGAVRFLLSPKGSWVLFASLAASLGSAIALGVRYSRVHPVNLLLLGLFTGAYIGLGCRCWCVL